MSINIQLINHACVLIDAGPVRLLTDPWLSGPAFNKGWDLLVPSSQTLAELDFNYLWYSHEHPDHFAPHDLLRIPAERRPFITVLYQETTDRKVADFCRSHGFQVLELANGCSYVLADDVRVRCGQHRGSDSWLVFETATQRILNINDCYIPQEAEARKLAASIGPIDVLLTQYSFANWIGNPGEDDYSRAIAAMYLGILRSNVHAFSPRFAIPFASFTYFCRQENFHLNRHANTIRQAVDVITATACQAIALYPMDTWQLGDSTHLNSPAIDTWELAAAGLLARSDDDLPTFTLAELADLFEFYSQRIRQKNDMAAIALLSSAGELPATRIHLADLGLVVVLDIAASQLLTDQSVADFDICMRSDSLAFLLRHEWGRGTLQINGRFNANYAQLWRFMRQTQLAFMNNIGRAYPASIDKAEILNPDSFILRVVQRRLNVPI